MPSINGSDEMLLKINISFCSVLISEVCFAFVVLFCRTNFHWLEISHQISRRRLFLIRSSSRYFIKNNAENPGNTNG